MLTQEDLFVIRSRITFEQDRARVENALRAARGPGRPSPGRAWLGRRLIALGTFLASDPGAPRRSITGRPG